jgi:potassium channel subfamily K
VLIHVVIITINASCARTARINTFNLFITMAHVGWLLGGPRDPLSVTLRGGRRQVCWHDVDTPAAGVLRKVLCCFHFFVIGMETYKNASELTGNVWTRIDLIYFCFVIVSTVGYGHQLVPLQPQSRVFTVFYSVTGLVIFGVISSVALQSIEASERSVLKLFGLLKKKVEAYSKKKKKGARQDGCNTPAVDAPFEPKPSYVAARDGAKIFFELMVVQLSFSALFMQVEEGWTFLDAFYHCMMTASTVGFGEVGPKSQAGRAIAIVHITLSTAFFAGLMNAAQHIQEADAQLHKRQELMQKQLDPNLISKLDVNNNGVDRLEFLVGMLTSLGVVEPEEVQIFLDRFDELDHDGSGKLDNSDLQAMVAQNQAKAEADKDGETSPTLTAETWARRQMLSSWWLLLQFFWVNLAGFITSAGGLVGTWFLRYVLGQKPTSSSLRAAAIGSVCMAICAMGGCVAFVFFFISPAEFYMADKAALEQMQGRINPRNQHVMLPQEIQDVACRMLWVNKLGVKDANVSIWLSDPPWTPPTSTVPWGSESLTFKECMSRGRRDELLLWANSTNDFLYALGDYQNAYFADIGISFWLPALFWVISVLCTGVLVPLKSAFECVRAADQLQEAERVQRIEKSQAQRGKPAARPAPAPAPSVSVWVPKELLADGSAGHRALPGALGVVATQLKAAEVGTAAPKSSAGPEGGEDVGGPEKKESFGTSRRRRRSAAAPSQAETADLAETKGGQVGASGRRRRTKSPPRAAPDNSADSANTKEAMGDVEMQENGVSRV